MARSRSFVSSPSIMARSLALVALSGAAAMAAQSATVSLLLPYADRQVYFGSVIGADSTATTYAYGCAPGHKLAGEDCGSGPSQTVTQGPGTWIYSASYTAAESSVTEGAHCKLSSAADIASCSVYMSATSTDGRVASTATSGTQPFLFFQLPVTVTAGLEKLRAATATDGSTSAHTSTSASEALQTSAASGAASTTLAKKTTASSVATSTTLAQLTTAASTGPSTASSTAAPSSTNAAGLVNVQNGLLAGVAVVVGGVMML
ncbi:hypothetical protein V8C34DRAFT_130750 [Trichoderma compactum]